MKKNKIMRLAGVLLIAVMLTMSIVSGTFAKYVTSDSVEDSARVAKFGVVVAGNGSLFDKNYFAVNQSESNEPAGNKKDNKAGTILTVESSNDDNLVAPGTTNDKDNPFTIAVTGKPEVDVQVDVDIDNTLSEIFLTKKNNLPDMTNLGETGKFNNPAAYYPVVFTLTQTIDGTSNVVAEGRLTTIQTKLKSFAGYYNANTNLAEKIGTLTLTWKWDFELTADEIAKIEQDNAAAATSAATNEWNVLSSNGSQAFEWNGKSYTTSDQSQFVSDYTTKYKNDLVDAAKLLRDQQDTLLGDIMAAKMDAQEAGSYDGSVTLNGVKLVEGKDFNLTTGISIAITVTQVD